MCNTNCAEYDQCWHIIYYVHGWSERGSMLHALNCYIIIIRVRTVVLTVHWKVTCIIIMYNTESVILCTCLCSQCIYYTVSVQYCAAAVGVIIWPNALNYLHAIRHVQYTTKPSIRVYTLTYVLKPLHVHMQHACIGPIYLWWCTNVKFHTYLQAGRHGISQCTISVHMVQIAMEIKLFNFVDNNIISNIDYITCTSRIH